MSHILPLASDFIERMSNPSYGIRVNEDYSIRLGTLLSSEGFEHELLREIEQLRDPEALTPHGWLWLLSWTRAKGASLDGKLLLHLAESFSSVFMQAAVIDLATLGFDGQSSDSTATIAEFSHPWLSMLLSNCTDAHGDDDKERRQADTRRAETVLIALMQVNREITLDAASTLLNHSWAGQPLLVQFFWSLCNELDDETQEVWISRLRPPSLG